MQVLVAKEAHEIGRTVLCQPISSCIGPGRLCVGELSLSV